VVCICIGNVSGSSLVGKTIILIEDFCFPQYLQENGEILYSSDHDTVFIRPRYCIHQNTILYSSDHDTLFIRPRHYIHQNTILYSSDHDTVFIRPRYCIYQTTILCSSDHDTVSSDHDRLLSSTFQFIIRPQPIADSKLVWDNVRVAQ
jgi:hypothetical protein